MRLVAAFALLIGLGASAPAHATTGLVWKVPAEGLRMYLMARVHTPTMADFAAELNYGFRAYEYQVDLVADCKPTETGKTDWLLACRIEDLALQTSAVQADSNSQLVLEELDKKLTGATVEVRFGADGRVKNVDLEGVSKANQRLSDIHEAMRLVLVRAFASLDHQLPKNGDDKGKGTWRTSGQLATQLPSTMGSMGSVTVLHKVEKAEGGMVEWRSAGTGVVSSGEMVTVGTNQVPAETYQMKYEGSARFDVDAGVLIERNFLVDGQPTNTSLQGDGARGNPYVQAGRFVLLDATGKPELPPTGPLPPR